MQLQNYPLFINVQCLLLVVVTDVQEYVQVTVH